MGKMRLFTILLAITMISLSLGPNISQDGEGEEEPQANRIAIMETDYGIIKFELYENWTPITAENFIGLAESGHYDGVLFHRIVDDFVIQTGDGGGSSAIPLEIHENATHVDGAVGMARSEDPDSAEDQFYICDGPQPGLDGDYAVFGIVIEGIEIVRVIAETPVYGENNPRPGAVVPPLWRNVGTPKEDVYVQQITINSTELNETESYSFSGLGGGTGFPIWVAVIIALPIMIVLFILYTKKK
jgi:cyclophilin family peptidyl-prolyl cis-trans isomerase